MAESSTSSLLPPAALLLVLLLAGACYALLLSRSKKKTRSNGGLRHLPPGSLGLPFLGQTLQFIKKSCALELEPFITNGRNRYRKIFRAHLFGSPIIVSTDTNTTKFVIQNEGKLFRTYYPKSFRKLLGENSFLLSLGEEHKRYRGIAMKFIGTGNQKLRELIPLVESAAIETIGSWGDIASFKFHAEATKFSFGVLCKLVLSLDQSEIKQLQQQFKFFEAGAFCLPINFPGTVYNKALRARAKVDDVFLKKIMERRQNPRKGQKDLLDMFLAEKGGLSNEVILDQLATVIFAGHESTAKTLTAVVKLLKESPESMEVLLKEHKEICKSKQKHEPLTLEDYSKMRFSQCVLNETLRLINVLTGMFRVAMEDVQLKDYLIVKDSWLYVSLSSIHHDPNMFPDSSTFDPFRWQKDNSQLAENFMPFGGGLRHCPGSELARLEIAIFLHHFVTKYSWEFTVPDEILHIPMISFPKSLPMVVKTVDKPEK